MKRYIFLALLLLSCHVYAQPGNISTILKQLKDSKGKDVLVAAHRGDWRNAPENSIQAITKAIEIGVDIIEIDIQKTKDGQLVLMHDATVDRTTNGKGYVKDLTLEEIKKLHLKNGVNRVTYHTIPTLEEAMLAVKGKAMVNLDKCYDYMNEAYQILVKTGTVDHAIFKGTKKAADVKKEHSDLLDKILYMEIVNLDTPDAETTIREFQNEVKAVAFELLFTQDTAKVFNSFNTIKSNGSRVWINSLWASLCAGHDDDLSEIDVEKSWGWIVRSGANVIQTDRPKELIAYLKSKGVRKK